MVKIPDKKWWGLGEETRWGFNVGNLNLSLCSALQSHPREEHEEGSSVCGCVCKHTHIGMQTAFTSWWCWIGIWGWPKWIILPTLFVGHCSSEFHTALKLPELSLDFILGNSICLKTFPQDTLCQDALQTLFHHKISLPVIMSCHQCSTSPIILCSWTSAADHR